MSSTKPAVVSGNGISPHLLSVGNRQPTPTPLGRVNTVPIATHATPRTLKRTNILSRHVARESSVPIDAYQQLDLALKLLNEKSEEIDRLKGRLLDGEREKLQREIRYKHQLELIEEEHQQELTTQQDNENFFKRVYLEASEKHKESDRLLYEARTQIAILEGQVEVGVAQVREHFQGQITQLRAELRSANSRADLFMEQASRTASVRRDAGEAPVLRERVTRLSKDLQEAREREQALTIKVRSSEDSAVVGNMRHEVARLMNVEQKLRQERRSLQKQLNQAKEDLEKLRLSQTQTQSQDEHGEQEVLVCQWATNLRGDWCSKEFEGFDQLRQHLIQNHLALDPA